MIDEQRDEIEVLKAKLEEYEELSVKSYLVCNKAHVWITKLYQEERSKGEQKDSEINANLGRLMCGEIEKLSKMQVLWKCYGPNGVERRDIIKQSLENAVAAFIPPAMQIMQLGVQGEF